MSVATQLDKLNKNLEDSYAVVEDKGGTLPQVLCFDNLPSAINTIGGSGASGLLEKALNDIVEGNNPVNVSKLATAESQISGFLLI